MEENVRFFKFSFIFNNLKIYWKNSNMLYYIYIKNFINFEFNLLL